MAEAKVEELHRRINGEVKRLLESPLFVQWYADQSLREGDLIVFNNSFLYREALPTNKNAKYLCVSVDAQGQPLLPSKVTQSTGKINASFKRVAAQSSDTYPQTDLFDAIVQELRRQGTIASALVGTIGDDQSASVPLTGTGDIQVLRYEPDQEAIAAVRDGTILLGRLDDIDTVWAASDEALRAGNVDDRVIDKIANSFEGAFHSLQEEAGRPINVANLTGGEDSILGQVASRLDRQVASYEEALEMRRQNPEDEETYNELLRIAYNFADGTRLLMRLVVGLSDLKPLIFWTTIGAQFDLAGRFSDLPFSLVGQSKPSLERYRQLIAAARNRAFHDIFAFDRSFVVTLPPDALEEPELRLFRDHARRKAPALDFEDRALVDLLADFTRAPERPIPLGFWNKNLDVMQGVATVAHSLRDGLLLASAR